MLVELPGIPVRNRAGEIVAWAKVDDREFHRLFAYPWSLCQGYARRSEWRCGKQVSIAMHREILGLEPGDDRVGDHINRDRLDNRRCNLRIVPRLANIQNTGARSGRFRGVTFEKATGKWRASVSRWSGSRRKQISIGRFDTEEEAAAAAAAYRAAHLPFSVEAA